MSCGFTRQELVTLLNECDEGKAKFDRYFFLNEKAPAPHAPRSDIPGSTARCLECGLTPGGHHNDPHDFVPSHPKGKFQESDVPRVSAGPGGRRVIEIGSPYHHRRETVLFLAEGQFSIGEFKTHDAKEEFDFITLYKGVPQKMAPSNHRTPVAELTLVHSIATGALIQEGIDNKASLKAAIQEIEAAEGKKIEELVQDIPLLGKLYSAL